MTDTVAVLGTGIMGAPMARNILAAGMTVRAWNRTRAKADPLAAHGATVVDTPGEAVAGADFVLSMLTDADAVEHAMASAWAALGPDTVWLQMSTVGVDGADRLADLAAEHDVAYVDAPVLGSLQPAEQGTLVVVASGPERLRERCRPVFDAVGSSTRWLGPAGAGSRLKLVVNSWVLALTTAVGEGLALARALGLDPQLLLDTMAGSAMDTPYAHLKGAAMIREDFPPNFPVRHAAKDAGLIVDAGTDAGLDLAVAVAVRRQLERVADLGYADADMAAVYLASRPQ